MQGKHWPVSETQRCVGSALLHLAAWASGYTSAQYWLEVAYIMLCDESDNSEQCKSTINTFAIIGSDSAWAGLITQESLRWDVFTVVVCGNTVFAVVAYLLVKMQVWMRHG